MKFTMAAAGLAAALGCTLASALETEPLAPPVTFRFGGGEHIKLIVYPETVGTSIEQIVSDDGYISLPTGGEPLNIKNKSRFEAQKLAAARIQKDSGVLKASADIALLSVPAHSVYIGGEGVKISQSIPVSGTSPLTLYAAILAAGGISGEGDPTRVTLSRTRADGGVATDIYDVSNFGDPGSKSLGPLLEAGDVVKVPRGEMFILAGEVVRAGPFNRRELHAGKEPRLSAALYATGGLKPGANRKSVKILRQTKDGRRVVLSADLDAAEQSEAKSSNAPPSSPDRSPTQGSVPAAGGTGAVAAATDVDPILHDGDIIVVGATGGVPVIGKVRSPGVYPINGQSIKLSRIIAMAGGFAEFAKTSSVIIFKANNPYSPVHVDMSLLQKGNFQDVELEDGDMIYVPERLL